MRFSLLGLNGTALSLSLMMGLAFEASAGCGDSYNKSNHASYGVVNICEITSFPPSVKVVTNWGSRPSWINNNQYAYLSNTVGDVWIMDTAQNKTWSVTKHFAHAGFTRVHPMRNGDLLLVGPTSGSPVPDEPLKVYEKGRYEGSMFVLKHPYTGAPVSLGVRAWEGVAVSRESMKIAWSETNKPAKGANQLESLWNYIVGASALWVGEVSYANGTPTLINKRKILEKGWFDFRFFEPQDFRGQYDQTLTLSAYGPGADGTADSWSWDRVTGVFTEFPRFWGYNEWEGASAGPAYTFGLIERDPNSGLFGIGGTGFEALWLWDFSKGVAQQFTGINGIKANANGTSAKYRVSFGNGVFSPDGKKVVVSADAALEASAVNGNPNPPGYAIGTVVIDFAKWLETRAIINN